MSEPESTLRKGGGRPGRSGPPLNLNNCRHPWRVYWRRRALRPEDRWVLRLVEDYEARLAEDRGRDLGFGETRAAEIAKTARVCQLLALAAFVESGIMRPAVSRTTRARARRRLGRSCTRHSERCRAT